MTTQAWFAAPALPPTRAVFPSISLIVLARAWGRSAGNDFDLSMRSRSTF